MRFQGKITTWHDEKGYGFVTQNGNGLRAFVHISAFDARGRRPVLGEIVSYQVASDKRGRLRAERVSFAKLPRPQPAPSNPATVRSFVLVSAGLVLFALFLIWAMIVGRVPPIVPVVYLGMSLVTLFAYGFDKSAAMTERRRTPEDTLQLLALACGWPGALFAQAAFRHKSRKLSFQVVFWLAVALNCGALGLLMTDSGNQFWRSLV